MLWVDNPLCNQFDVKTTKNQKPAIFAGFFANFVAKCDLFVQLPQNKTVDFLSAIVYNTTTALGGELAVPCNSQSATARLKDYGRFLVWKAGPYKEC